MCRRSDSLKRKSAVSNCKAACGAGFRRKGGIGGKTQSKILSQRLRLSFESVVDFIDTLRAALFSRLPFLRLSDDLSSPVFHIPYFGCNIFIKFRFVADQKYGSFKFLNRLFEFLLGVHIQMIGRLVQHQKIYRF